MVVCNVEQRLMNTTVETIAQEYDLSAQGELHAMRMVC